MDGLNSNGPYNRGPARRKDRAAFHHLAIDMSIAASSDLPILITGEPHRTLACARLIVARSRTGGRSGLRVCDVARGGGNLFATIQRRDSAEAAGTVLIREVQNLRDTEQAGLANLIAYRRLSRSMSNCRVIATSTVSLFERVMQGTFDARLFYLLNAIHLVVPSTAGL